MFVRKVDYMKSSLLMAVTVICIGKYTRLLRDLYITNLQCFLVEAQNLQ